MTFKLSPSRWTTAPGGSVGGAVILVVGLALVTVTAGSVGSTSNNIGGGEVQGSVTFEEPGVPPLFAPCRAVDFTLDGDSRANLIINVQTEGGGGAIDGFAGEVELNGVGHGFCDGASSGSGTLTITVPKATAVNEATFECEELKGGYVRATVDVQAVLGGTCSVNSSEVPVMFYFHGEFNPTGGSGLSQPGVSEPIMTADFKGTFVVMPA